MGPWDGMDSRTHASVEGQVDIPWKVPCNPMRPWDGMDNLRHFWTALTYAIGSLKEPVQEHFITGQLGISDSTLVEGGGGG